MTFAKTVMNSMSIFYMQLYKLLIAINKEVTGVLEDTSGVVLLTSSAST